MSSSHPFFGYCWHFRCRSETCLDKTPRVAQSHIFDIDRRHYYWGLSVMTLYFQQGTPRLTNEGGGDPLSRIVRDAGGGARFLFLRSRSRDIVGNCRDPCRGDFPLMIGRASSIMTMPAAARLIRLQLTVCLSAALWSPRDDDHHDVTSDQCHDHRFT